MTERAVPVPDADSEPFWTGAREGRLRIQRCMDCRRHIFYPRSVCPHCMSVDIEWVTASGNGTVYSYTIVHEAPPPGFDDLVPYVVGLVDLDEGVRMMTQLEIDRPTVGQRVVARFRDRGDGLHTPYFEESPS